MDKLKKQERKKLRSGFWRRSFAMVIKEFIQMKRDHLTFAMMLGIPAMQLILFGFAINTNPKDLPTAIYMHEESPISRSLLSIVENTGYFRIDTITDNPVELQRLVHTGQVQFALEFPPDFEKKVRRGEKPAILILADATDPSATGNAIAALQQSINSITLRRELMGSYKSMNSSPPPFEFRIHPLYNPAAISQLNIVPALLGVVLTMTMLLITALAVTREIERGTMENLLVMPLRSVEIMVGKIIPYVMVGAIQMAIILVSARYIFGIESQGSLWLLVALTTLFIVTSLAIGYTFSTIASNQLQAMQMTFLYFLPNILLSGFMFPFRGMPQWAQYVGEALPLTHYLRIVRGIVLKGNTFSELTNPFIALSIFTGVAMLLALARFKQTLD